MLLNHFIGVTRQREGWNYLSLTLVAMAPILKRQKKIFHRFSKLNIKIQEEKKLKKAIFLTISAVRIALFRCVLILASVC